MFNVSEMAGVQQCSSSVVVYMHDGFKACLFLDDADEAQWLAAEIDDSIQFGSQDMLESAIRQTGARWGENSKARLELTNALEG